MLIDIIATIIVVLIVCCFMYVLIAFINKDRDYPNYVFDFNNVYTYTYYKTVDATITLSPNKNIVIGDKATSEKINRKKDKYTNKEYKIRLKIDRNNGSKAVNSTNCSTNANSNNASGSTTNGTTDNRTVRNNTDKHE